MSSALWLLLYLAPLLGLTAAVFAWFGWQWRGSDMQKRMADLQTQIADTQQALHTAETERETAHSQIITTTAAANTLREQTEDELRTLREDLQSAQHETHLREGEAAKAREGSQALETEVARLLRDLELLRHERDQAAAAQAELSSRQVQPQVPEVVAVTTATATEPPAKPKRKRSTPAKAKPVAATPATLREKTTALVNDLAQHQSTITTLTREHDDWLRRVAKLEEKSPKDAAGLGLARRSLADSEKRLHTASTAIERLQSQARVLHRTHEKAAALAAVADDDLTQIKGIKKVISEQLRAHGIRTWKQIAQWDADELRAFSDLLAFKNRATREKWQEQARSLHEAAHGPLI
ncbi:MAG: hypothetical protein ACKVY0_05690 [Prosthecobacter sp.]|uniref:hypothetical protein n=1 Tax=Prosthecobacter sp. TaxID=1965333 RepID=UPI0038FD494E